MRRVQRNGVGRTSRDVNETVASRWSKAFLGAGGTDNDRWPRRGVWSMRGCGRGKSTKETRGKSLYKCEFVLCTQKKETVAASHKGRQQVGEIESSHVMHRIRATLLWRRGGGESPG